MVTAPVQSSQREAQAEQREASQSTRAYTRVAWCYDELASLWSRGAIDAAKKDIADALEPGEAALFAGVGRGRDAWRAAARGVSVTGVDRCPAMLARAAIAPSAFAGATPKPVFQRADFLRLPKSPPFDAVVASFVLNLWSGAQLEAAISALAKAVRPGGTFWVADFAPPAASGVAKLGRALHYWPVAWAGRALGLCSLHAIHDYSALLPQCGLQVEEERDFSHYRVWKARSEGGVQG